MLQRWFPRWGPGTIISPSQRMPLPTALVVQQGYIDGLRVTQMIQDKAQPAGNGRLFKDCNAVLDHLGNSLRASREAVVRGVAHLGKDAPLPARRAWRFFMPSGCNRFTTR